MKRNPFRNADMDLVAFIVELQKGQKVEHHLNEKCRELNLHEGPRHVVFFHDPGKYTIHVAYDTEYGHKLVSVDCLIREPEINIIHPSTNVIPLNPIYALFAGKTELRIPRMCTSALSTRLGYDEAFKLLRERRDRWMTPGVFEQAAELKKRRDSLPVRNPEVTLKYTGN